MCGIAGIYNKKGITEEDIEQLKGMMKRCQERGEDATGFFNSNLIFVKAPIPSSEFLKHENVEHYLSKSIGTKYIVGHCRHETRGSSDFNKNNHPLFSSEKKIFVVSNGFARSEWDKDKTLTDTYAFLNGICYYYDEKEDRPLYNASIKTMKDMFGLNVVVFGNSTELIFAKTSGKPFVFRADKNNGIIERILFGSTQKIAGVPAENIDDDTVFGLNVESGTYSSVSTLERKSALKNAKIELDCDYKNRNKDIKRIKIRTNDDYT